jgi:uncharacterized glyoxalase superfamily protein PhnB
MAWWTAAVLGTADVRRIAEWYRDELGFTLDPENGLFSEPDEGVLYGIVSRDGAAIHFQIRPDPAQLPPASRDTYLTDLYVYVDDVDALYETARARNIPVIRDIYDEPYGTRDFAISDPDGHHVVFGSPLR